MQTTINQRIANLRKASGLTQGQIAEKLGMNLNTYSKFERQGKITVDLLFRLSEVLEIDVYKLLTGKEAETKFVAIPIVREAEPQPIPELVLTPREEVHIKNLRNISDKKRVAIYRLALLSLSNKRFDIVKVADDLEKVWKKQGYSQGKSYPAQRD